MKKFRVDYTMVKKVYTDKTRVIEAENEADARDIFYDLILDGTGECHAKNITELKYRCLTCETKGNGMHGIECPTRKRKAFASGKSIKHDPRIAIVNVVDTINKLCDADERGRMQTMPAIITILTVEQLTKIVKKHGGIK